MKAIADLKVKLFADGADRASILELYSKPWIQGFTTNPTLMRHAGVTDYERFARDILRAIPDRPISFEVLADDFEEMEWQAQQIASWGPNVYVKVPITNTLGASSLDLVSRLSHAGMQINVTAILTLDQVRAAGDALAGGAPSYVSVFAGRVADTGRDPLPLMAAAVDVLRSQPQIQLIWASPRELLNVFQAESVGCPIITSTADVLKKLSLIGKDLDEYSLDTVKMFFSDARKAGFTLARPRRKGAREVYAAAQMAGD